MVTSFEPQLLPTGIGSLPHRSSSSALGAVRDFLPQIPFWPQLPKRDRLELMHLQFLNGFPGLIGEDDPTVNRDEAIREALPLFEAYLSGGEWVLPPPSRAACLHDIVREKWEDALAIKGHIIGPITLGLSTRDEDGVPILHSSAMREILVRHIALSTRMQVEHLGVLDRLIILFVDEPYMSLYGSAQFSLSPDQLEDIFKALLDNTGAITGIHCCGNTDWALMTRLGFDILSFDAFDYGSAVVTYREALRSFVRAGGILSWGIVPTGQQVREYTQQDLADAWLELARDVAGGDLDLPTLARRSMLTPACGLGTLEVDLAEEILARLRDTSRRLRDHFSLA